MYILIHMIVFFSQLKSARRAVTKMKILKLYELIHKKLKQEYRSVYTFILYNYI